MKLFVIKADLSELGDVNDFIGDNGGFAKFLAITHSMTRSLCYIIVVMRA